MDLFECNISGGEFPADYDTMVVGTSYAYDDDLEYLHNSAISFRQLFQSDNLGPQRQKGLEQEQKEPTSSPEMEEDWLRNLLSSEDSFDPDFLENLDMESLDQKNVLDEGEKNIVEDVSLSASLSLSQFSEVPESFSLVELLSDGPGAGISRGIILGSQWEEGKQETSVSEEVEGCGDWPRDLLSSEFSLDPDFLEQIDVDHRNVLEEEEEEEERELVESVEVDEVLGYTVEMETMEGPEDLPGLVTTFPPTPPQSPEEKSERAAAPHLQTVDPPGVTVVHQPRPRPLSVLKSASLSAGAGKVIVKKASPTKVGASGKTPVKTKKCRMLEEERAAHNQLERERRKELNNAYDYLRDNIPAIADRKKSSKQLILDAALDYCRGLEGKLKRLERIQEEEVERRRELGQQLARLQSEN